MFQTYNMDAQVGESSACATALLCGVKANYETVGLDSSARFENCISSYSAKVPSLITWAQQQGNNIEKKKIRMILFQLEQDSLRISRGKIDAKKFCKFSANSLMAWVANLELSRYEHVLVVNLVKFWQDPSYRQGRSVFAWSATNCTI